MGNHLTAFITVNLNVEAFPLQRKKLDKDNSLFKIMHNIFRLECTSSIRTRIHMRDVLVPYYTQLIHEMSKVHFLLKP